MSMTYYVTQITEEEGQTTKQLFDYPDYKSALSSMYAFLQNAMAYDTVKRALCVIFLINGEVIRTETWGN